MAQAVGLDDVMDALPALVSVVTKDGRYAYANAAYQEWFGLAPDAIIGRNIRDVLGDAALDRLRPFVDAALSGAPQDFEMEIPYADGSRRVRAHYEPQRGADGDVVGYVALVTDAGFQASADDVEDFVANANVGLHWVDAEGRVVWANRFELELLGYEPEEYIGHPIRSFHTEPAAADRLVEALKAGQRIDREEACMRRKDGSSIDVLISSSGRFEGPTFLHTRCVTVDITERKQEERARRLAEARLLHRQGQQEVLVGLGRRALTTDDLDALLEAAADGLVALGLDHVAILEHRDDGFILRTQRGWGERPKGTRLTMAQAPQAAYTLDTQGPVVLGSKETRFPVSPLLTEHDVQGGVTVPIVVAGAPWGVLGIHSSLPHEHEPAFAEAVANVVAGAIQRHLRESDLQAAVDRSSLRERQQEAVAQLGRRALASSDLATLCRDAAECIASTLKHEFAAVLRWLPQQRATQLVGQVGWGDSFIGSLTPAAPDTQIGYTLRTMQTVIVPDLGQDDRFRGHDALRENGVRSGMSIAIPGAEEPWGVITTHSKHVAPYTIDHAHFLEAVANLLASAVHRFHSEEAMRVANEELTRLDELNRELSELGQRMAATLDVDELTQMVTDHATRLAGAEFGAFFFNIDEGEGSYMLYTLSGVPKERFAAFPMPRKTDVFAPTFEGRGTVRSDDITKEPMFGRSPPHHGPPPGHLPVCSYLAVPVKSRSGDVLGGLFMGHSEPARFGDAQQHAVEALAGMAAVAMQNARLYEATKRSEEDAQEARRRAQEADRRKDEFLAMLGHELRNPLAPIQTSLDLLSRRGTPPMREHDVIRRQVKHLIQLVDDLMDVSRITRGMVQLDRRPIAAAAVVERAVEMAQPLIEQRQHALDREVDVDVYVEGDFERLAQVMANLLTNAAKYTEPGGRIQVRCEAEGSDVVLQVTDNGVGIEPELLPQVFDTFRQGAQAADRARGGLGLGLAIVRSLTTLHGGSVVAHSDGAGRGSRFTVRLPMIEAPARLVDPPQTMEAARGTGRVLVVDDNTDVAESLRDVVASLGYEARLAYDGPSALAAAAAFRPDVVLLDIGLPIMDGYELAAELRGLRGDDVRLVAISGYGGERDRERSREAGIDDHLVKPVGIEEVGEALASQLAHPRSA